MDGNFSEKRLGFSSFKQFALAMVDEVFDKVEMKAITMLAYFPRRKPGSTVPARPASPRKCQWHRFINEEKAQEEKPDKQPRGKREPAKPDSKSQAKAVSVLGSR
ncbi:MAG: hypothetical protein R3B47_09620 [Bacteroidia bacterium]